MCSEARRLDMARLLALEVSNIYKRPFAAHSGNVSMSDRFADCGWSWVVARSPRSAKDGPRGAPLAPTITADTECTNDIRAE
jgi:hypothetical protein